MPTKPTVLPKWASDDVVDGTTGQNNVVEPSEPKKLKGWDYEEKPSRQFWNWLHRLTYQCIDWLFGTTIPLDSSVGTANEQLADGTGHTHAILGASQVEAEDGTDNEKVMTPLRTAQAIQVLGKEAILDGFGVGYVLSSPITSLNGSGLSVSAQATEPRDMAISNDGLTALVLNSSGVIYSYDLVTPFDLSSGSYSGVSGNISAQDADMISFAISSDGTKLIASGSTNDRFYQYTLSTAWDISTIAYDSISFDYGTQGDNMVISLSPAGDVLLGSSIITDTVYQYNLATDWDLSTISYSGNSLLISGQGGSHFGIDVRDDGLGFLTAESSTNAIYEYQMTTAFNLSTASYSGNSFSVSGQTTDPRGVQFSAKGFTMFLVDNANDRLLSYSTSFVRAQ